MKEETRKNLKGIGDFLTSRSFLSGLALVFLALLQAIMCKVLANFDVTVTSQPQELQYIFWIAGWALINTFCILSYLVIFVYLPKTKVEK